MTRRDSERRDNNRTDKSHNNNGRYHDRNGGHGNQNIRVGFWNVCGWSKLNDKTFNFRENVVLPYVNPMTHLLSNECFHCS